MNRLPIETGETRRIRQVLATVWIVTGVLSLGVFPQAESLKLLASVGLEGSVAVAALYGSASLDISFGLLTLIRPSVWLWRMQAGLIIVYSIIIAICLPAYWLHPFGPMLKNLPILLLLWMLHARERRCI